MKTTFKSYMHSCKFKHGSFKSILAALPSFSLINNDMHCLFFCSVGISMENQLFGSNERPYKALVCAGDLDPEQFHPIGRIQMGDPPTF